MSLTTEEHREFYLDRRVGLFDAKLDSWVFKTRVFQEDVLFIIDIRAELSQLVSSYPISVDLLGLHGCFEEGILL